MLLELLVYSVFALIFGFVFYCLVTVLTTGLDALTKNDDKIK